MSFSDEAVILQTG